MLSLIPHRALTQRGLLLSSSQRQSVLSIAQRSYSSSSSFVSTRLGAFEISPTNEQRWSQLPVSEQLTLQTFCAGGRPFSPFAPAKEKQSLTQLLSSLSKTQSELHQAQSAFSNYLGQYEALFGTDPVLHETLATWTAEERSSYLSQALSTTPLAALKSTNGIQNVVECPPEWENLPTSLILSRILSPPPPTTPTGQADQHHPATMECISIIKRRKKKMNKHKWRKRRRDVRNSTRYNKERKNKGEQRSKME